MTISPNCPGRFFAIWGLLLVAGLTAAFRYVFEPGINSLMLVVGLWNTFNMMIAGVALGAVSERAQPDRHPRLPIQRQGALRIGEETVPVDFIDVSGGGVAMRTKTPHPLLVRGAMAELSVAPLGHMVREQTVTVEIKRSSAKDGTTELAAKFCDMQPHQFYVLAELMYGDGEALCRFLDRRRTHQSIWQGSAQFLYWGVTEPVRAFRYLWMERKAARMTQAASSDMLALAAKMKAAVTTAQVQAASAGAGLPAVPAALPAAEKKLLSAA